MSPEQDTGFAQLTATGGGLFRKVSDEVGLAAMEGVQGFEGLRPDFGWEYLFPDTNFGPWTPG
jgi:hypothetical protein